MTTLYILIMAAGQGTRMKSRRAKVLHELAGRPMIGYVCKAALALRPRRLITVVGHQADDVTSAIFQQAAACQPDAEVETVLQAEQRGTGHAVRMAENRLAGESGTILVLSGDVPLVRPETLAALLETHQRGEFAATVLATEIEDPTGYGRIVRGEHGEFERIVEQRDATPDEARIREINSGIYAFNAAVLFSALARVTAANAQGEYYLTDVLGILKQDRQAVGVLRHGTPDEVLGINSRLELAAAAGRLRREKLNSLMRAGVTIHDPGCTYIDDAVEIGADTIVYPNVTIEGATRIGENCRILPGAHLSNAVLGNDVTVRDYTLVFDSDLADGASVGPFAHLRMNSSVGAGAGVGNFVELKKTALGAKSKAMHLTYLGDAVIGERVNIGAGTVTCNYDGKNKHTTIIGDEVKIGSDTMLVAPVTVGKASMTGAGSVVTRDVPPNTLVAGVPASVKKTLDERPGPASSRSEITGTPNPLDSGNPRLGEAE